MKKQERLKLYSQVINDPSIEERYGSASLFPEKLAKAKETLKKYPFPKEFIVEALKRKSKED